ncbi:Hypothetical predicted protein [Mytilus galloprovincialis]|uniref:Uncharacterized protein n=1 Tax=Mytilus galloprovincialis TaxID=29158 RepID=A0A8B6EJK1_MYTGA|nr:Hypothetical predicted protein [Mytilus galloprovincialis]
MKCLQCFPTSLYISLLTSITIHDIYCISAEQSGQYLEKRGPMSYVVNRGCPYLTHYVHDNYFLDSETISKTVTTDSNWVQLVYQTFIDNYVPLELFHGLVTCGKAFSLYAINPSQNIINVLKTNFTNIPGVGK